MSDTTTSTPSPRDVPRPRALDGLAPPGTEGLPLRAIAAAGLDAALAAMPAAQAAFLHASGFSARAGELRLLSGENGLAGAVLGLGEEAATPWTYGDLPRSLPEGTAWHLEGEADTEAAVLGWALGAYGFHRYRAPKRQPARLVAEGGWSATVAEAMQWVRDLINTPASDLGPAELLEAARLLAAREGADYETVTGPLLEQGFPALATVGAGSSRAPGVGILRWTGAADGPLVALCGKGVCFDTGGLDLKPAAGMLRMKKDMGGAATVLGLATLIMRAKLPVQLLVMVGAVENSVSGNAFRPGDVLRTRKGLTVEIGNTDAEGRLVLADLLAFATEQKPSLIVDCATLTGAARVALGPDLPALFSNDDETAGALLSAGERNHDPVWRLPLRRGYDSWLDSPIADINNVSSRPMAGAVVAALFLNRFVPHETRWVHLDLYAWNDSHRAGRPEGGEAQAIRALHAGIANLLPTLKGRNNEGLG